MDYSPPGSSVLGISQARTLEWVTISFSRGSSWETWSRPGFGPWAGKIPWIFKPVFPPLVGRFFTTWVTMEAHMRGMVTSKSFKIYLSHVKKILIYTVNRWQTEHNRPSCFLSAHRWTSSASNSLTPRPQIAAIKLCLGAKKNSRIHVQTKAKQSTRKASSCVDLCP